MIFSCHNNKVLVYILYTLLVVCMGFATFVEKTHGSDFVGKNIYGSWWFITLWAVMAIVSLLFLIQKKVYKHVAVLLLHVSFMVILIGAFVTHLTSESGTAHLRKDVNVSAFTTDNGVKKEFPFSMRLADFKILYYPGTDAVMDYRCEIDVEIENKFEKVSVSMNKIGKISGYRFYQSSYDSDGEGSHLLVAYDPYGIAITYFGYLSLFVSLLWVIFSKHTRIRELYRKATVPMMVLMLSFAQNLNASVETRDLASSEYRASSEGLVDKKIADEFGKIAVLYNGRICPLNTVASEFVTKLSGKSSWNAYSANEIFVGWMIFYTQWEKQKLIKVKSGEVQKLIGIDDKWASVLDFYTPNHKYKLSGKANDTSLPASFRKSIRETDEKLQVVTMFYNSEMLHIFPLNVNGKLTWFTPGSTELPKTVDEAEFQFINHAMDEFTKCVLVNDVAKAKHIIAKIKLYQKEKAGEILPSPTKFNSEIFYNTLQHSNWIVYLYLTLSIILCFTFLVKSSRTIKYTHVAIIILALVWLTTLLALRWWISGHVPMSNGSETMLFMAWITLVITLVASKKIPELIAFGPVVSGFCMLVSTIALNSPQITNLMPVLQSPLLSIHVAMVMISYSLFAMVTLIAVYGLILYKKNNVVELERMTALSTLILYPAVVSLSVGIFIGAIWANVSWGSYWSWDPKETWALITLMIYAVPLHKSFMPSSPIKHHLFILISFLTVLMTYFGVNYFLSGMHSYA